MLLVSGNNPVRDAKPSDVPASYTSLCAPSHTAKWDEARENERVDDEVVSCVEFNIQPSSGYKFRVHD